MIKFDSFFALRSPMNVDTLIHARWIIPVEPERVTLEDHTLVIAGGKITDLLPRPQAERKYRADAIVALNQHALIPGLVNAHTHAGMSLLRGIADDLALKEWLQNRIWPMENKWVGEAFVRDGTDLAVAEMLKGGVTCFNDMYFYPEIAARQALHAGIRASIGLIVIDFPSAWASGAEEYLSKGLALYDQLKNEPLISMVFAPHAPYTVSDESLERMRVYAEELDLPVHMHLHETRGEIEQSLEIHGQRPLERLRRLGLLGPSLLAVHMTQLTDDEIAKVAESGASIIHCPESNLKLASGFCPVAKCLAAGINVALGTDSTASNNDLDLFGEMRIAALLAKGVAQDARAVPAPTALRMATLNGAKALRLDHKIGSLAPGKSADVVAIRLDDLETQPLFDPISHIVYAADRHQVTDVWIAGRHLVKERNPMTIDVALLQEKVAAWGRKLASPRG